MTMFITSHILIPGTFHTQDGDENGMLIVGNAMEVMICLVCSLSHFFLL